MSGRDREHHKDDQGVGWKDLSFGASTLLLSLTVGTVGYYIHDQRDTILRLTEAVAELQTSVAVNKQIIGQCREDNSRQDERLDEFGRHEYEQDKTLMHSEGHGRR